MQEEQYLSLLAQRFKTDEEIVSEIINLESILELPKGTEHFVSDLHGEYQAFQHVLRNGSGNVKVKIRDLYGEFLSEEEINEFATLIYYPEEKLELIKNGFDSSDLHNWYICSTDRLLSVIKHAASKYTCSKLRRALPQQFVYVIEELLYKTDEYTNKRGYYAKIVDQLISLDHMDNLITGLAYTIQKLVVDHLHVVGDIYDRGPEPHKIVDTLIDYHSVDIQWGNHDILWIGAFSGSRVCLANIIRICARYNNLDIIEDAYGINLRQLVNLAEKYYSDNPSFYPKINADETLDEVEKMQITKIHQAISIIQFKLEGQITKRRNDFEMKERSHLENIDYTKRRAFIKGEFYNLVNCCFSTVDALEPNKLLEEEEHVINKLLKSFQQSEKLARHMNFLMDNGSMYLKYNGNLLFHGCIPLNEDGSFRRMDLGGRLLSGRDLLDAFEEHIRLSFAEPESKEDYSTDLMWYLWTGRNSSLFGKEEMTTFERYFIRETAIHKEFKNPYYYLRDREEICRKILSEFDLDADQGCIINGHTPVKEIDGEDPVKGNGKLIVIDGGFSKAYQATTGIAGYTLLYNSYGMQIVAHQLFNSKEDVLLKGTDVLSTKRLVNKEIVRKRVRETNVGEKLIKEIANLQKLRAHNNVL